jgi:hypothetical protein
MGVCTSLDIGTLRENAKTKIDAFYLASEKEMDRQIANSKTMFADVVLPCKNKHVLRLMRLDDPEIKTWIKKKYSFKMVANQNNEIVISV